MKKPINDWWYFGFIALTITIVSIISWNNIRFMANLAFVSGVLGLIRVILLKFGLITTVRKTLKPKNQIHSDLLLSIVLFVCALIWLIDPHSSIGYTVLLLGLFTKMYIEK